MVNAVITGTLTRNGEQNDSSGGVTKLFIQLHPRRAGVSTVTSENRIMANTFGTDILIQTDDPKKAARFYADALGFSVDDPNPKMIGIHGKAINLFIEPGPPLGPVLEVTVGNVEAAKARLLARGCVVVKDEPQFPRCYVRDPYGLIYNLRQA